MAPNSPGSFSLQGGSDKSWHNNWIKIWPTATCMEVTGVFPVSRGPHFLSEWQGGSGVKEKGQRSVLHQLPALSPVFSPFLLNSPIQCIFIYQVSWRALLHFPSFPLSVVHAPSFISPLFLPPSCWHALPVPPGEHTRIDLTISAIQPPKSNYHGHNSVIKSNGLLEEAPTLKQNKSFSTLLHIILCVTLPGRMNRIHTSAQASFNYGFFSYLKLLHTVDHKNSNTLGLFFRFSSFLPKHAHKLDDGLKSGLQYECEWMECVLRWTVDLSTILPLNQQLLHQEQVKKD